MLTEAKSQEIISRFWKTEPAKTAQIEASVVYSEIYNAG